jgi:predicted RNA binding protein YcfA (HicA-like mRNA interferase family)
MARKEERDIRKLAKRYGYSVSTTGGGHFKLTPDGGGQSIIAAHSTSDVRAVKNLEATLRRAARNRLDPDRGAC